jgi:thiamine kinase-like enzyme
MTKENEIEVALQGGRTTLGVVRIGDTVRRPVSKNGDFVHRVLRFFEKSNFEYAPRFLGIDKQGREILSYIEGTVPDDLGTTSDNQLFEFMKIVRRLHDLSKEFTKSNHLVVCHSDLSPCNVVFRDKVAIAIIDWDGAYIGEPWEDLAYICWLWINLACHTPRTDSVDVMKNALISYGIDEATVLDFSTKFMLRMDKALRDVDVSGNQYERVKIWVDESKLWVRNHRIEIQTKIEKISKN